MNGIENNIIGLDTNIFIYYFEENPLFLTLVDKLFKDLEKNKFKAITSVISLTETLSFPKLPDNKIEFLHKGFSELSNFTIIDVTETIAVEAAKLRRKYHFRLGDAIQIATAIQAKADIFITNDERLTTCKEMKIRLLK
ncbi:MAG TPA: PIN domain-containing protein [Candidatus Saccharimonadales bacterium]|nr:PIN domain-containing protein [Candidatus Saccharimonadales bacterium]